VVRRLIVAGFDPPDCYKRSGGAVFSIPMTRLDKAQFLYTIPRHGYACALGLPKGLCRVDRLPNINGNETHRRFAMGAVDEKVKQIIVEQLQVDEAEVTPGASFQEDLGADSLDVVELVMQFEEAFDIQIPDEDAEKIKTVKDAIDYIEKNQKGK